MRLAVISDIHGNLVALEAVLADLEAAGGADLTWCLGDLAAFGPRPAECVARIRGLAQVTATGENGETTKESKTFRVIGGNADRYLVTGERLRDPSAKDAAEFASLADRWQQRDSILNWGVGKLAWEDYEYLKAIRGRELWHEVEGYGTVIGYHAVPGNDESFLRPETSAEEAADYLLDREGHLGIGGHTHFQMDRQVGRWRLVNVGSVGLSFEQPGIAQYGLFDFAGGDVTVTLRQVAYDVAAVIDDLQAVGHPYPQWFSNRIRPQPEA